MKKLHRAGLSALLIVLAAPLPAQRPHTRRFGLENPSPQAQATTAGAAAFAIGGLSLIARARRR